MTPRQLMGGSQAAAGFLFLPVTVRFVDRLRLEEASGSSKKPHKTGTLWWLLPPPSLCFAPNRLFTLPYPALLFAHPGYPESSFNGIQRKLSDGSTSVSP